MDVHSIICKGLLCFFGFFPIKNNKVVFSSYYGKYYSDNPMYIFEAMAQKDMGLDYVWLLCDEKTKINNARVVKKDLSSHCMNWQRQKFGLTIAENRCGHESEKNNIMFRHGMQELDLKAVKGLVPIRSVKPMFVLQ